MDSTKEANKTNTFAKLLGSAAMLTCSSAAFAGSYTINFQDMADGAWGESAWNPMPIDVDGNGTTDVNIFGKYGSQTVYAYLDAGTAGLGTCRELDTRTSQSKVANTKYPSNGGNLCKDGSDDNVSFYDGISEGLQFSFLKDLDITGIWFNNNHDNPKTLDGDTITIGNVDHMFSGAADNTKLGWLYSFGGDDANTGQFNGGSTLDIKYKDEQFYISAVVFDYTPRNPDIPVPLPSTLALFGLGLAGLGARRRRK